MQPASTTPARSRSKRLLLVLAILVASLLVLGVLRAGLAAASPKFHATTYEPPEPAADFTLTDHSGGTTRLSELQGTPVLLFFGYTHCPDVCPLTLATLRDALAAAGAEPGEAKVLLVTVDPARDTPEALAPYVRNFGPDVVGLTGPAEQIEAVLSAYGIHAEPGHADPGLLGHTSAVYGIDRNGMIRVLLRPDAPREQIREDVATLLEL